MKKSIILSGLALVLLASCSKSFENKETVYEANVKGFYKTKDDEEKPVFCMISLTKVIDGWDGDDKFEAKADTDKLIKVELKGRSTDTDVDMGITESAIELYDASTKKTYTASSAASEGLTFKGGLDARAEGYAVYSVPADTKTDNLYIGVSTDGQKIDWSKEDLAFLLPLKKQAAPVEKTVAINSVHSVEDIIFNLTKVYTIKDITYNCEDANVKKYRKETGIDLTESFVRINLDIKNGSSSDAAYVSQPFLYTEYGAMSGSYGIGEEFPSTVAPGATVSVAVYYGLPAGTKSLNIIGEDKDGSDYVIELAK